MSTPLQKRFPSPTQGMVVDLAVNLGPVLAVADWLKLSTWREGRAARAGTGTGPELAPEGRRGRAGGME